MSFKKALQAQGSFTVELVEETPGPIVDALTMGSDGFSRIMYLPAHVDAGRFDPFTLSTMSIFTGVLMRREGDVRPLTLEGAHCTVLLGDDNGRGYMNEGSGTISGSTWEGMIADFLSSCPIGGGAIQALGGSFDYTRRWDTDTPTPRSQIDWAVGLLGAMWEVDDTMFLNAGQYDWMFNGYGGGLPAVTPVVIVDGYCGPDPILNAFPGTMHGEEDIDSTYAARVLMDGGSAGAVGVGSTSPYLDGFGNPIPWKQKASTSSAPNSGDLTSQATTALAEVDAPSILPTVTCTAPFVGRYVRPGQVIGVWDPRKGLADYTQFAGSLYETLYRGRRIYPAQLTVQSVEMPWTPGGGLYAVRSSDNTTVLDLTRWVQPEDQTVRLEVGSKRQSLKVAATQRGAFKK